MAGQPRRRERERLEADAARRRAARANPTRRRAAVARAEQVGDELAAREFNVKRATIRSWRRVVKREGPEPELTQPTPAEVADAEAPTPRSISGLEGMRKARDAARAVEAQAVEQTQTLLAAGKAREAQAASQAGGVWSDKALALDKAIVAAEAEHEVEAVRLTQATLALHAAVLRGVFDALGLPVPTSTMRTLAEQASRGEPLDVPAEIASADRERVRIRIRDEHREQLLADGWSLPGENGASDVGEMAEPEGDVDEGDQEQPEPREREVASPEEIRDAIARGQRGYGSPYGDLARGNDLAQFRGGRMGGGGL